MHLQAFWRAAGLSGQALANGGKCVVSGNCDRGPLCVVFDGTSSSGNASLIAFIGGEQHLQYETLSVSVCIAVWQYSVKFILH